MVIVLVSLDHQKFYNFCKSKKKKLSGLELLFMCGTSVLFFALGSSAESCILQFPEFDGNVYCELSCCCSICWPGSFCSSPSLETWGGLGCMAFGYQYLQLNTLHRHSVRVLGPVAAMIDLAQVVHNLLHRPQFNCCHFQILHCHCPV
jgi:hypothetical protein